MVKVLGHPVSEHVLCVVDPTLLASFITRPFCQDVCKLFPLIKTAWTAANLLLLAFVLRSHEQIQRKWHDFSQSPGHNGVGRAPKLMQAPTSVLTLLSLRGSQLSLQM